MSPTWQIVAGVLSPLLVFAGVVITARVTRQGGREATRSADWASFAAEVREWTEDRLAERDARIDCLERDMRALRDELAELSAKYRAAIAYVRRLVSQLRQHVEPSQIEPPPRDIETDVGLT